MTTIARSYKYRLYPTPEQEYTLEAWQLACWEVQRWCIKQRRWASWLKWRLEKAEWPLSCALAFPDPAVCPEHPEYTFVPNQYTQRYEVTARRATNEQWTAVPAHTMYEIVYRVDKAWGDARLHDGEARWADRPSDVGLPFTRGILGGIEVDGRYASATLGNAAKLGAFRFRYHRPIPDGATIQQAYITRAVDGWYVSLSCKVPAPEPLPATGHAVGVDLNCIHQNDTQDIAALSDGRTYSTPDNLKKSRQKLAHLQKMVSKRRTRGTAKGTAKHADPNSNRTRKRREQIARKHQKIARQREHELHYIARRITDTADEIKFEDVNWANLRRQGTPREAGDNRRGGRKANKGRNRSMSTASPGKLRELTQQKAAAARRVCGVVDARNTSKACSACGGINEAMTAAVREWDCPHCGAHHNRDTNAAKNILARDYKDRKKRKTRANYKPRRNERNRSNPSALGDMPGEGTSEHGSVNLEPTARESTSTEERTRQSTREDYRRKKPRAEAPAQNAGVPRSEQKANRR